MSIIVKLPLLQWAMENKADFKVDWQIKWKVYDLHICSAAFENR